MTDRDRQRPRRSLRRAWKQVGPADVAAAVPGERVEQAAIIGSGERCRARLAVAAATGVGRVVGEVPAPADTRALQRG